tara:strand:+ start:1254 stop:1631 length:378 start_codon:yes stop_codon:yes gene_type:complete
MAFISTAEVREIRNALKKEFPEFRFGVKKRHYHAVDITVKKGPALKDIPFDSRGYAQINEYHLDNYGKSQKFLERVVKVIKTAPANAKGGSEWYDNSDAMTDYFDTAFYFSIKIGYYNKGYEVVN